MNLTHQVYKTPTGESRSMIQEPVNAFTHRFRLIAAGIFVVAAILYFTALGKTPLRVNAEIRCHDVIANMLERSDYIVPIYNGRPVFTNHLCFTGPLRLQANWLAGSISQRSASHLLCLRWVSWGLFSGGERFWGPSARRF